MKKLLVTLAAVLVSVSTFAQGTINFSNRNIQGASGAYNVRVEGDTTGAVAQLFLVSGGNFTAVPGQATFRTTAGQTWAFQDAVLATVPGVAPGQNAQFVMRVWKGASFDTASIKAESATFTVGPLGGENPTGGLPFLPPDLAGPGGVGGIPSTTLVLVPEPSTIALGLLGAAALLYRRRK